jgi:hypothetical protein
MLAQWDISLLLESEHVSVKAQGLFLIIDEDACQVDPHVFIPSLITSD